MRWVHSVFFVLAVLELTMVVLLTRSAHVAWPPLRIAGLALLILTVAWVGIARLQLGRSFSVTPQARKLITTGVYARIRNPIYFASPFLLVGFALFTARWSPLLLLLVVIPLQIVRARREAEVLRATFGAEYDRYRAGTWF